MSRARQRNDEAEVAAQFAKDVSSHVMTVEQDSGVFRVLRFARPGSNVFAFRLVTWPGHLYVGGDSEDFVFQRLHDMFTFFRSDAGRVNLPYWSEKLTAVARGAGYEQYDPDVFREAVEARVRDTGEAHEDWDAETRAALANAVEEAVLSCADDGEAAAHVAARDFTFRVGYQRIDVFPDFWEVGLRRYTYGFAWACHAVVWGIAQYDAAMADRAAREGVPHA
jgi:hypothetical protein